MMKSTPRLPHTESGTRAKETLELMSMDPFAQEMSERGRERARDQAGPRPSVLLLPGLFAGAWIWEHTRRCLSSRGYRVLMVADPFALLDLGITPISTVRSYLNKYFDELKISKAILCGNSFGALVALDFAVHFPHRVDALVISGAPGFPGEARLDVTTTRTITLEYAHAVADYLFYDRSCLTNDVIETTYALLSNRTALINIARALKTARDYDVGGLLTHIDCPVSMIWGANDRVTPVSEWEHAIWLVKHGTLRKVAQCGHCPMVEQPHEFNTVLLEFLSRLVEDRMAREAHKRITPGSNY